MGPRHYPTGRPILTLGIVVAMLVVVVVSAAQSPIAQTSPGAWPRTADGQPDLQGVYNFSNSTPMERPPQFAGKTTLTPEEVEAYQRKIEESYNVGVGISLAYDARVWKDAGKMSNRTSLIVDPPDGRIPALTPEAAKNALPWTRRPWTVPPRPSRICRATSSRTGRRTAPSASGAFWAAYPARHSGPKPTTTWCRSFSRDRMSCC